MKKSETHLHYSIIMQEKNFNIEIGSHMAIYIYNTFQIH